MPWGYVELHSCMYKVKKEENIFLVETWLPLPNDSTRVRLLQVLQPSFFDGQQGMGIPEIVISYSGNVKMF